MPMNSYELVLTSSIEECDRLAEFLEGIAGLEKFGDKFLTELGIVAKEAFINAVLHGNEGVPGAVVHMTVRVTEDAGARVLFLKVWDMGKGFSLPECSDPLQTDALMKSSGRGLLYIKSYAEIMGLEWDENGCWLTLRMMPF